MKSSKFLVLAALTSLVSPAAFAATAMSTVDAPDNSEITLTGVVEDFDSEHAFMLRDRSGTVKIDLSDAQPIVLKDGEKVSITGNIHHTILGTDVVARNVTEDKGLGQAVGEAIDSLTGQDAAGSAQAVTIQSLPKTGLVKVNGTVDSVDNGKKFTLKDATGRISVAIKSGESASLDKGTAVMVVGNVASGILGKKINAIEVDVVSSSAPVADEQEE